MFGTNPPYNLMLEGTYIYNYHKFIKIDWFKIDLSDYYMSGLEYFIIIFGYFISMYIFVDVLLLSLKCNNVKKGLNTRKNKYNIRK